MRNLIIAFIALPTLSMHAQSDCATALPILPGIYTVASVVGQPPTLICAGNASAASAGIWYSYTPLQDTLVRLSTSVDGFPNVDTRFHVYSGTCAAPVCHAGDDDSGPGFSSIAIFSVTAGVTYRIAFDSYWTAQGFTFQLTELNIPDPPAGMVTFINTQIPGAGYVMGVVDMNGDALDDVVTPGSQDIRIAYQLAAGGYNSVTIPTSTADHSASWSMAAGDIDGNGFNDLMYGGGSGVTFMIANATGTAYTELSFTEYIFSQRTNFVDLNADGHLDAFVCHDVDANVYFLNDGSNNLSFNQGGLGSTCGNYGSIWTDYDNDGRVDLFVAKCGCDPVDLLMRNNGDLTFSDMAPSLGLADGHQSWSSAWGDFDNDGDMDIFIGSSSSLVHKLMRNNGDGTFTDVTIGSGMEVNVSQSIEWTTHDFNNDGYLDILGGNAIHYNSGDMTFSQDPTSMSSGPIGDLNNDGFLDIVSGATARINQGNDNNWIKIHLEGVQSNRNGIGARVTVTSALGTQIRDVKSGDGFEYMSSITAHFGLGQDTEITEVRINWPSGIVDVIPAPPINATFIAVEGMYTSVPELVGRTFSVFPNPATDLLTLDGVPANATAMIFDASGKLVSTVRHLGGPIAIGELAPGVYQVVVDGTDGRMQARFTKQ